MNKICRLSVGKHFNETLICAYNWSNLKPGIFLLSALCITISKCLLALPSTFFYSTTTSGHLCGLASLHYLILYSPSKSNCSWFLLLSVFSPWWPLMKSKMQHNLLVCYIVCPTFLLVYNIKKSNLSLLNLYVANTRKNSRT